MSHFLFIFFLSLILLNQRQLKCIRYVASGCVDLIPIEKKKKKMKMKKGVGIRVRTALDLGSFMVSTCSFRV